ncbi:hypothetical protein F442_06055 [Phytophthora nicotianae P10297]|uniref:Uncharacterized protein n=3 Tax=Phytophthora nicotianae TaxID=4792 RepID=W2ZLL1_PHYNI|nr:hypothetical protein L917_05726 [Phytophthora nicotianae]ETO79197.1 hypothetical protein F444_06075 [Phytophthora nicotianae P1976]ETP48168.1 hypothetical protein F442_06055 [Phytophthora nicotianae P10297]
MREARGKDEEILPHSEADADELIVEEDIGIWACSNASIDEFAVEDDYIQPPLANRRTKGGDIYLAATTKVKLSESKSASGAPPMPATMDANLDGDDAVANNGAAVKEPVQIEDIAINGDMCDPTDQEVLDAEDYMRKIMNQLAIFKVLHPAKKQAGSWHVSRSRKRKHQAKCAVTRSETKIDHANFFKAMKMEDILNISGSSYAYEICMPAVQC